MISAAAASLGGTSGLAWGPNFLRGQRDEGASAFATRIPRDVRVVTAAAVAAFVFAFLLGPGIRLG